MTDFEHTISLKRDIPSKEYQERKQRASLYMSRFKRANRGMGYHNCAGLVKFVLGLSKTDGFVRTGDSSEKGLIRYLKQKDILKLEEFNNKAWIEKASRADAVAFLHNEKCQWQYLHFLVPNPDPDKPFEVIQRNGFEEIEPEIADIRDVIKDESYAGDSTLVFFKKIKIS